MVAILLANMPVLLHLVTTNPLDLEAFLSLPRGGFLPGLPYIDPNAGYTTQALGHLAAMDWFHGHVPWWNADEGLGAPLAGEMQSGAFFPLTLLLALNSGLFILQLVLELLTGLSTYFLARGLGVGRTISAAAGVAFGLCGTYAWFAHAPIRPVLLLPLCLLGVERTIGAAAQHRAGGWVLLSVALCLSVLAGFPETSLIDGVFVVWWAILRIVGSPHRAEWQRMALKLVTGLLVGVALSAPLLAAITGYLPDAFVGGHNGGFAHVAVPAGGLSQLILPYSLGPIFGFHSAVGGTDVVSQVWGSVGGFLSVTLVAAGLAGLCGRRMRLLRLGLAAWIALCLLRTFGFPPVVDLLAGIPGIRLTAFYRYSDPSWELAVVVLAGLGLDDVARGVIPRRVLMIGSGLAGALAAGAAATAWRLLSGAVGPTGHRYGHADLYPLVSVLAAGAALLLLALGGWWAGRPRSESPSRQGVEGSDRLRRYGRIVMGGAVAAESVLLFGFTLLSAPAPAVLRTASVTWLQNHLGSYRFVTLGPVQPNYGSYFGIASANVNDIPLPKSWVTYAQLRLDPNSPSGIFTGGARIDPRGPTPAEELTANLANYEKVGVRYVLELADGRDLQESPFPAAGTASWPAGPRLVHRDTLSEIWELPTPAPPFSLEAPHSAASSPSLPRSCGVTSLGWDRATVRCPRPSVLVRRVQYLPGWSASANGVPVAGFEWTSMVPKDCFSPSTSPQERPESCSRTARLVSSSPSLSPR